ncbi:stage V sporulation protein [Halarchaeum acidiphilum MH1-52-1]|uniref:Stage V sporulation protein n=1 Tax=Halarchaeum acidiphilum MH1-52-1 TaxID=1261545 RepID=U2YWN8_9EURY|nr:SpoVR family protein [Halarchaeum acidiphilum]GAD53207.1 stage V sporulation protein [Halarchaeum acidiphilum MH1-52-1]
MTTDTDRLDKQRVADRLDGVARDARALAEKLGLDPYDVHYWIVDHDEMNELIAYGGFQTRYPHWRWGMEYDRQRKQSRYLGGKAFEIVNNDDPAAAFLQESNALADQKAVITHVEAHSDFFANNRWFGLYADEPAAAATLERHAETIEGHMNDPEIDRAAVESFVDSVLCVEDVIDQHRPYADDAPECEGEPADLAARLDDLGLSEDVQRQVFEDGWAEGREAADEREAETDLLAFLARHGKAYDEEAGKAVEYADWQRDVIEILRREAYYFAPQKQTKVMNEGWAAFHESLMMGEEAFAGADEFVDYADHQSRVLNSSGLNPYALGKQLWEYVENTANRREVVERLLRVEGVTWRTFHEAVDFDAVQDALAPPDAIDSISPETLDALDRVDDRYVDHDALDRARGGEIDVARHPWKALTTAGLARRHYSLVKPRYRGFLRSISRAELERTARYLFDDARYATVADALAAVDFEAGWERMRTVREDHNDVTFLDEFLTQEFVDANGYFAYEFSRATERYHATSTDADAVKKKLLLRFANFGKPTVVALDANHRNRGELLLGHEYNGVAIDLPQAKRVLERLFELWGRPVALRTITTEVPERELERARRQGVEPETEEVGLVVRYDGESFEETELGADETAALRADAVDYDTTPADWPS